MILFELTNQGGGVPISTLRCRPAWPFCFHPEKRVGVKYSQMTMIFFSIISSEHVEFFLIKRCGMIFYLGSICSVSVWVILKFRIVRDYVRSGGPLEAVSFFDRVT
jgi:hypothetical protein